MKPDDTPDTEPPDDFTERAALAERIKQQLRELDEIEAELKKQRGDQPLH